MTRRWPLDGPGAGAATVVLARVDPEDDGWLDDAVLCHRCFAETVHGAASSLPHAFEAPALAALGETFDARVGAGER